MPSTKRRVAVNLPDKEFDELMAFAENHDVSMAWLGRRAILEFLNRYRTERLHLPLALRDSPKEDHAAQ